MTDRPDPHIAEQDIDFVLRAAKSEVLVDLLLHVVAELESLHPGRKFTPDGHLVGSLGEAAAEALFDIRLTPTSTTGHDAIENGTGRKVEIKATFGTRSIAVRSTTHRLDGGALVVLRLSKAPGAAHEVIFDGPAALAVPADVVYQSNGQAQLTLGALRAADARVPAAQRVRRRAPSGRQGSLPL